jgi:hypothetical protein
MPTTVAGALTTIMERMRDPALGSAYLGSLPTPAYLPGLADANPQPGMVKGVQPRIWIGTASHIAAHYDAVDNLACVVAGHRRFTLYPPQAIADLYAGPIDHTLAGQPVSMATEDPDHPERYPNFPRARSRRLSPIWNRATRSICPNCGGIRSMPRRLSTPWSTIGGMPMPPGRMRRCSRCCWR